MDLLFGNSSFHRRQDKYVNFIFHCMKGLSMAFFAWVLGYFNVSFSIVFISVTIYVIHLYWKKKRKHKRAAGKAVCYDERNAIITTMKDLPSWVFFPDIEKAEWLNKVIAQVWPFLTTYVKDFLIFELQPIIEEKLPNVVKPFRFSKMDLGDMSPRVGGIKTYCGMDSPRDEVSMDVEFYLYSDAGVKVEMRGIQSGIKDLEIRGTLRILLRPLIPKIPLVGAVTVCFINNPYINFELTNLGSVLEFPGVGEIFRGILEDLMAAIMVLPNRFSFPLVKEVELSQLRHPIPQGLIRIHVESASNLIAMDMRLFAKNTSDPYCILKVGAQQFKTAVIKNTLNPSWNEYFEAIIDQRIGQVLELTVYDKDTAINKGDFLGRASLPIEDVYSNGEVDTWVQLEGVKSGSVHLIITWMELSAEPKEFENMINFNKSLCSKKQFTLSSGFLYVVVDSARGLKAKSSSEPSSCGRITFGNTTKRLKLVRDTPNPVWEKVCHFGVVDPELDSLKIELYHNTVGEKSALIGDCLIPTKVLMNQPNLKLEHPFQLNHVVGGQEAVIYLRLALRALVVGKKLRRMTSVNSTSPHEHCHRVDDIREETIETNMPFRPRTETQREEEREQMSVYEDVTSEEFHQMSTTQSISSMKSNTNTIHSHSNTMEFNKPSSSIDAESKDSHILVTQLDLEENALSTVKSRRILYGQLEVSLSYSNQKHALCVTINKARNLVALDADGVSDPYVKVRIEPKRLMVNPKSFKTVVMRNTLNPHFNETFDIPLEKRFLSQAILVIIVRNHVGTFQRGKKSMGNIRLKLSKELAKQSHSSWFPIVPPTHSSTSFSSNAIYSSRRALSFREVGRSSLNRFRNLTKQKKTVEEEENEKSTEL